MSEPVVYFSSMTNARIAKAILMMFVNFCFMIF